MRRRKKQDALEEPTVNLTPLIDVVFVILIMFIVVAPLLEMDKVQLAEGSSKEVNPVSEASPITIHVQRDNTILFNGEKVNLEQLVFRLSQARGVHPKINPQLYHDKQAHFGTYQAVKNAAENAGFQELDVILKPS